jgi:gliding motility-associated-like protein
MIKVQHHGIAYLKSFVIFNRWGNKVFETKDIEQGWDGKFNGQAQPMGTYIYYAEATTYKGKRFYKQGNILLIR